MKWTNWRRRLAAALATAGFLAPSAAWAAELNVNLTVNGSFESAEPFPGNGPFFSMLLNDWIDADGDNDDGYAYAYEQGYAGFVDPPGAELNYYTGGFGTTANSVLIRQSIAVGTGPSGALIQTGNAVYDLSGYFTSYDVGDDASSIRARFLNASGTQLGQAEVGGYNFVQSLPITELRREWGQDRGIGPIPIGTTSVELQIVASDADVNHDGYVDLVNFLVTDTPVLPTLDITVNRANGAITLRNRTSSAVNLASYSITSADGGLNSANWFSITDNYDANSGGTVDPIHNWMETSPAVSAGIVSEAGVGGNAILPVGRTVNLTNPVSSGLWLRSPTEDLVFSYNNGSTTVTGLVNYIGNGGASFEVGDFNADGQLNADDWIILRNNQLTDLSGLSPIQSYLRGDLTRDNQNNYADFRTFANLYNDRNGPGSFEAMVASLPEPGSLGLIVGLGVAMIEFTRRSRR